ncbi:hypothetical protein [Asticcacaulis tiandongensis]|uniref:hypothetical protein n=1 Tax=Asticcacaulis tiandongensis TaxID=2565365 RepID=UPI001125C65E|nr:hypothetical protein [Asticcacaulis tiandongensis]
MSTQNDPRPNAPSDTLPVAKKLGPNWVWPALFVAALVLIAMFIAMATSPENQSMMNPGDVNAVEEGTPESPPAPTASP